MFNFYEAKILYSSYPITLIKYYIEFLIFRETIISTENQSSSQSVTGIDNIWGGSNIDRDNFISLLFEYPNESVIWGSSELQQCIQCIE